MGVYALVSLGTVLVQEKGADLARTAVRVAATLDRVLFERFGDIQLFANDNIILEGKADERIKRLLEYKKLYGYYSWIGVTDAAGRIIADTDVVGPQERGGSKARSMEGSPVLHQGDWLDLVKQSGGIYLQDAHLSPESQGGVTVGFSAPIYGPVSRTTGASCRCRQAQSIGIRWKERPDGAATDTESDLVDCFGR